MKPASRFGERGGAGFSHALAVDRGATAAVATGGFDGAGLTQLGIDARFERGAAFRRGHVDIAIGNANGHGLLSRRFCGNGRCDGSKGDQGESETHGILRFCERVSVGRCR